MAKSKFIAVREGDSIVIRLPLEQIEESIAEAKGETALAYPVTVTDADKFIDRLVAMINSSNAVEAMLGCEVGELIEARARCVKEHVMPSWRRFAA